jgi:glycosyltransferase A (GT-A) superfamily protein (DUF2064 family)
MKWSSAGVAAETIARIEALGWSDDVRETLRDVDAPEDLAFLPETLATGGAVAASGRAR